MKYDSVRDANLYLHGSIVRWKDKFVYVSSVGDGMIAKCYEVGLRRDGLQDGADHKVLVDELDLTPAKLGYTLDKNSGRTYFIERIPTRAWRQGLTQQNCKAKGQHRFRMPDMNSRFMLDILKGRYPSINKASRIAKKKRYEVPFHRLFTIDENRIVRYKTQVVGGWDGQKIELLTSFNYLKEMIKGNNL